jgi:hypothetical protein
LSSEFTGNPVSKHSTKERDISSTDEVPFTDSGYASLPNPQFSPTGPTTTKGHLSKGSPAAEQDETLQDDAQTVYSTGTSIAPVRSRRYVLELAQDIYDKTRKYLTPEAWPMLSNTLPDLIKALALKIGQEESSQMNRQIMCFVHKRQE